MMFGSGLGDRGSIDFDPTTVPFDDHRLYRHAIRSRARKVLLWMDAEHMLEKMLIACTVLPPAQKLMFHMFKTQSAGIDPYGPCEEWPFVRFASHTTSPASVLVDEYCQMLRGMLVFVLQSGRLGPGTHRHVFLLHR